MLSNLEQRGGGVMTLQDDRGEVFDSIVFAEKENALLGAGQQQLPAQQEPRRSDASRTPRTRMVHVAVVYEADGTVTAYRDGKILAGALSKRRAREVRVRTERGVVRAASRHQRQWKPGAAGPHLPRAPV